MGVIVAAHCALVAIAWQPASTPKAAMPQRVSMRLLASVARPMAAPVLASTTLKPTTAAQVVQPSKPRAAQPAPRVTPVEPAIAAPAPPPVQPPIQGVAFAPAAISFGPPPARRETTFSSPPPPPNQFVQAQSQAQTQLHAARTQIADALQRELGAWQPPLASEGACALAAQPEAHLACDNDALTTAIAPREPMLAGLLRAWRSMDPRTQGLTIAVVDGRYQANWN